MTEVQSGMRHGAESGSSPDEGLAVEGTSQATEQPWQALLDSAGEGIWGVDLDGNCTFVNRAALGMLGFDSDELLGRHMHTMGASSSSGRAGLPG